MCLRLYSIYADNQSIFAAKYSAHQPFFHYINYYVA